MNGDSRANGKNNVQPTATIILHCGQYTKEFTVLNGRIDSVIALKNGKRFNSFLIPEPVNKLLQQQSLKFLDSLTPNTSATIEQRITGIDTTVTGW